jgi:uracil-DNA glycosylase family 4
MIVGDFPGYEDIQKGRMFCGYSGDELAKMLSEAGIMLSLSYVTAALKLRPLGNDITEVIAETKKQITPQHVLVRDKFCLRVVQEHMDFLRREIEMCQPNVIIALGNVAMWMLTGEWGITSWRSSIMQVDDYLNLSLDYRPKVIPTFQPGMVMKNWSWRPIMVHDLRRAKKESEYREVLGPQYEFILRPRFDTVLAVLHQLFEQCQRAPGKLAVDIETRAGHISCLGIAWSKTKAICIPFMDSSKPTGYWSEQEEPTIVYALYKLLTHPNCHIIGQNFNYDAQYIMRHWLFTPNLVRDTLIAQHSLFGNMQKSLDFLSSMYCDFHLFWKEEGRGWVPSDGEEKHWTYNCKDCVITFEVDEKIQETVDKMGMREVHDFQQSLFFPVLRSMHRGVRFDIAQRSNFAMKLQNEIMVRQEYVDFAVGRPLNIASSSQMQQLLYEELKLQPVLNRKTKRPSCDDEALRKLSDSNPVLRPLLKKISEMRSLGVFFNTFVSAPLDQDSRMRCTFNIGGTETYRFSSKKNAFGTGTNLQNIPSGGGGGSPDDLELPNVRTLFIPDPGMTFFDIDLSSADLRIVVWESDETEMKDMLRQGLDPYTEIAKEFYHDPTINKKDPRRQTFKAFAHGTNYLGTAKGLAERLGLSVSEAEKTQKWYFGRFPRIKKWQDNLKDQVLKRKMVQNVFGYRCYFFDRIEGTIFNQAAAWIPQSTVACIINRAYVKIDTHLKDVEVLLQVHDSLAGQYPTALDHKCRPDILKAAEIILPYADPLVIPVGIKTSTKSWGDCS